MLDAGTALISMRDPEGNGPGHLDILETELGRAYCRWTSNVTAGVPRGAAQARSGSGYQALGAPSEEPSLEVSCGEGTYRARGLRSAMDHAGYRRTCHMTRRIPPSTAMHSPVV